MTDPYGRGYRPGRGSDRPYQREDYEPEYEYPPYPPGRGGPPPPDYDRSYRDQYERERPPYDPIAPSRTIVPRSDYRPTPPTRPEPEYSRPRGNRDYPPPPPPGPRGAGDGYVDPNYYPQPERPYRPPQREPYPERVYRPEPNYQEDARYAPRRRPREEEFEPSYGQYDPAYYEDPSAGRRPAPIEYRPGQYEQDLSPSHTRARRPQREAPPLNPSKHSPEGQPGYYEFDLPAEGIKKEVLQRELTLFLGGDATMRGPIQTENGLVFKYSAYRQFTSEQIRDLKTKSSLSSKPIYTRGREEPPPSSGRSGRRKAEDDSMATDNILMEDPKYEYVYGSAAPGTRAPAREIRAGRGQPEPQYSTSYHETARHGRPTIEVATMRPDDDDEMED